MSDSKNPFASPSAAAASPSTPRSELQLADEASARRTLLAIAAFQAIAGTIFVLVTVGAQDVFSLVVVNLVAAFYGVLGFLTRYNAKVCLYIGLVAYVSLLLLDAVFDPTSILRGILVKLVIIAALVQAIQSIRRTEIVEAV